MLKTYSILNIVQLIYFKIRTKLLFRRARLIRFPFRVRGKRNITVREGFTSGFNCRLDAFDFNNINKSLIEIGINVQINDNVHIGAIDKIIIEDNVLIASKVFISDHNHGNYSGENQDSPLSIPRERKLISKPIFIRKNVWIGEFVSILPGVTIGEGSIIGCNSVVTKNIPPFSMAVGSPALVIKKFDFTTNQWKNLNK